MLRQHNGALTSVGPGSDPRQGEEICLLHNVRTGGGVQPASYSMGTTVFSLGERRSGREADHAPPSSVEFKRLRMSAALPLLPLYAFVAWKGTNLSSDIK